MEPNTDAGIIAERIVRNLTSESSQKRYKSSAQLYHEWLVAPGANVDELDCSPTRKRESDPVFVACALIIARGGPQEDGFEGIKAKSTGGAMKSAIMSYWRRRGIDGEYVRLPDGSFTGNPGKSPDLQSLINRLDEAQRISRANITRRAYQETHEDVRAIYYRFVEDQLPAAIRRDPTVNYSKLQVACLNIMQFSFVSRGSEMLALKVKDFCFTGNTIDSPIVGILPITKNWKTSYTYFRFSKAVDVSNCGIRALMGWFCVLRSHAVCSGNLFVQVKSNVLQGGTKLDGSSYVRLLRGMGEKCGIYGLAEHSPRRGGAGYYYYALRRDLFFLYRAFSWESLTEMLKYVGLEDVHNSYALLGFTAFGTNELFFSMQPTNH